MSFAVADCTIGWSVSFTIQSSAFVRTILRGAADIPNSSVMSGCRGDLPRRHS